jgi:polyisoprenoid-binding protein YceI
MTQMLQPSLELLGNAISNVKLVIAAKNLKSEKGSMMNNKAYKALKADEQPNITFTAASLPVGKTNVNGRLTIAGVTKTISFPVNVVKNGNSYNITGTETLKMSDYGMETPGFLGVHTGDAVTVTVNVVAN